MSKIFAEKLKEYRKELSEKRNKKVGQIQLAEELGISKGNIGNLEAGKRLPSKTVLMKLVDHSGKGIDYWLDGVEEYEAPNTLDLVLDKMIEEGLIKDTNIDKEAWDIITEAVLVEVERKLQ
ncbi:helix-turn-helix domain-containing protein [Clostridium botulinum]|uniref:helix-turn-helix domain-containing protein n=1 Tax=Clostridium botulinum TaxID=1491 RepID=UPI000A16D1CD|nr:helix-turn-helix transcriptional regulator [Clostridium botulinum]AUN11489.1 transcriptional regulator [Clostridium botulinum]OSA71506.1 transcriptional regulator [Clostridium botulinum]